MDWVSIGSGNGLSTVRRQTTILTKVEFLSTEPLGANFGEIRIKIRKYIYKNTFANVVWKMAAILSRERWVN